MVTTAAKQRTLVALHCLLGRAPTVRGQQDGIGNWTRLARPKPNQQVEMVMMMTMRMLVMVPTTLMMVKLCVHNGILSTSLPFLHKMMIMVMPELLLTLMDITIMAALWLL